MMTAVTSCHTIAVGRSGSSSYRQTLRARVVRALSIIVIVETKFFAADIQTYSFNLLLFI